MKPAIGSALLTDLYQLTMLQAYFEEGIEETAVFELFVRKLPHGRNFLVAAGLAQALEYVEALRFGDDELEWVEASGLFRPGFAERLSRLRFTGDIHAMPEGTVFFPNEPVIRVTAPLPQAQLLETRLLNLVHFETMVASRAARCVLAAHGKRLIDFGLRRAHAGEAGLLAARAAWLAGFDGTATAEAAPAFGIPVFGTMAHSYVQAHDDESQAFERFARAFPKNAVLLIDTYDTLEAARKVGELAKRGIRAAGVRLDSGNLEWLSRETRRILNEAGLGDTFIFASGNLDERRIAALVACGAPIDSFGVGTSLTTSSDAPYLDAVYKLQEYAGRPRRKRSAGKATWPGRKQVWRECDARGTFLRDHVTLEGLPRHGEPLLDRVMHAGHRVPAPTLEHSRAYARSQLHRLPQALRSLGAAEPYAVEISGAVRGLADRVDQQNPRHEPVA